VNRSVAPQQNICVTLWPIILKESSFFQTAAIGIVKRNGTMAVGHIMTKDRTKNVLLRNAVIGVGKAIAIVG